MPPKKNKLNNSYYYTNPANIVNTKHVRISYRNSAGEISPLPKNSKIEHSYTYKGVKCGWHFISNTNNKN